MSARKPHFEFTPVDLREGFAPVPDYPPGFHEKILAGALDEKRGEGNRTRLLRIDPGAFSTEPFVHEYWEEVFMLTGDLIVGNDKEGCGGEKRRCELELLRRDTGAMAWINRLSGMVLTAFGLAAMIGRI